MDPTNKLNYIRAPNGPNIALTAKCLNRSRSVLPQRDAWPVQSSDQRRKRGAETGQGIGAGTTFGGARRGVKNPPRSGLWL